MIEETILKLMHHLSKHKFDYFQQLDKSMDAGKTDIYAIRNDRLFLFKVYDRDCYENMMDSVIRLEHDKELYGMNCFDNVYLYYVYEDRTMAKGYYCERTNSQLK